MVVRPVKEQRRAARARSQEASPMSTSGSNSLRVFWCVGLGAALLALSTYLGACSSVRQADPGGPSTATSSVTTDTTGGPTGAGSTDSTSGPTGSSTTAGPGGSNGSGGAGGSGGMPVAPASARVDQLIDDGWKFNKADAPGAEMPAFNDSTWTTISVPHTWNAMDGQDGPTTTPAYYRGVGWYRRHYAAPSTMMGMKIYRQFDESSYITDVWVNGKSVGTHKGGYAAFRFDVTSAVMAGADNVIAVKVDNSQAVTPQNAWIGGTMADVSPISGDFTMF